jgi:hypothetical protein
MMNKKLKLIILVCFSMLIGVCSAEQVWTLDVSDSSLWQARPSWISGNAARVYEHSFNDGMKFSVNELSMGMKWVHYPNLSLDPEGTYYLKIVYRSENIPVWLDYAFLAGNDEQSLRIELTELIDDGCLHTLIRDIPAMDTFERIALQCQVSVPGGYIELAQISVFSQMPERKISQELPVEPQWGDIEGYSFAEFATNQTVGLWFTLSGYSDVFTSSELTVSDVPFKLSGDPFAAYSTELDQTGEFELNVSSGSEAVYLLLGSRFEGDEWPSIGYGSRNDITQPDQFRV